MMDRGCSQVQAFHGVAGHSLASHTEKQVGYLAGPEMKFGATLSLFILFFFVVKLQFHKFGFTVLPRLKGYTLINGVGHFWKFQKFTRPHLQGYTLITGVKVKGIPL